MTASLFGVGSAVNVNANGTLVPQSFVGTAGQTLFLITNFTYTQNTNSLLVFINGNRQILGRDYTETSTASFTLTEGVVAGDFVDVIGFPQVTLSAVLPGGISLGGSYNLLNYINDSVVNIKQYPFLAKCDGVTDDTVAWQAAHDYVEALAGGGTLVFPTNGQCKINGRLFWNPNKVAVNMQGAKIDASGFTGPNYLINLRQTITDPNIRGAANRAHPWSNGQIYGTASAVGAYAAVGVIDNNPITGNYWAQGITFISVSFYNWYRDIFLGNGGFFFQAISCSFGISGGTGYDASILLSAATNGGENISFLQCFFSKVNGSVIRNQNPNSVVFCYGCSADYTANIIDAQAGQTFWDGYIESNTDSDYWIKCANDNVSVRVKGEVVLTAAKALKEIFYSDATTVSGGLDLDVNMQYGPNTYPLSLVGGTGRSRVRLSAGATATVHPALGLGNNFIGNGQMLTNRLTDWTLTGTLPTADATHVRPGAAFSLKVVNTGSAVHTTACRPGESLQGELYYWLDGVGASGGTFLIQVDYRDQGGTSLAGSAVVAISTNASVAVFTRALLSMQTPAPAGTVNATLQITMFGVGAGTPAAYCGDIKFSVA